MVLCGRGLQPAGRGKKPESRTKARGHKDDAGDRQGQGLLHPVEALGKSPPPRDDSCVRKPNRPGNVARWSSRLGNVTCFIGNDAVRLKAPSEYAATAAAFAPSDRLRRSQPTMPIDSTSNVRNPNRPWHLMGEHTAYNDAIGCAADDYAAAA